jgi:hypothetical protein
MADAQEHQQEEAAGKKKARSPAYPAESLETCIAWARKIYDAERKSTTSSAVAASHIGYKSLSGPARVALSAVKKFGLIVDDGTERIRVSEDAVRLFFAPDDDQRLLIVQAMAQRPEIIRELLSGHPDGLPSDETLKYKLIAERNFSEDAAKIVIKVLRETVRFAKLDPGQYTPAKEMESQQPAPSTDAAAGSRPGQAPKPPQPPGALSGAKAALHVELSDGTVVDVHASGPLNADTFEELKGYLEVYERVLRKRAAASASDPG